MDRISNGDSIERTTESTEKDFLFNDFSTADTIIKLKPSNQLIFAHSSILSKSPFFDACKNFKESNGYIEITTPSGTTASFSSCIEYLYFCDSESTPEKSIFMKFVKSIFFADIYIDAMFLQLDNLMKLCTQWFFCLI